MIGLILGVLVFAAVLLVLVVMMQNPKGGGVAAGMGGSSASQFFGVKKTGDILENATWGLAILVFILSFSTSVMSTNVADEEAEEDSDLPTNTNASKPADTTNAVPMEDSAK